MKKQLGYKVDDLQKVIDAFLNGCKDHGRYLSFDHCYKYFNDNYKCEKSEIKNQICLHFFSYLASWGMLRNSFLLYKDYLFSMPVVEYLCKCKKEKGENKEYEIEEILDFKKEIINLYKFKDGKKEKGLNTYIKNGEKCEIDQQNWDTLVTKILMGTLGCVPAYDRFFKETAKNFGITQNFGKNSIEQLKDFVNANQYDLEYIREKIKYDRKIDYPIMKLVDMYFWQSAYSSGKSEEE